MGDFAQAPAPTTAPPRSTSAAVPARAAGSNALSQMQGAQGNAAAQEALAGNGGDAIAGAQGALRDTTSSASVSVAGRLPGSLLLGQVGEDELRTGAATRFQVGVGRSGLWANFHPALLFEQSSFWGSLATGGIQVSQLYFDFRTGQANLSFDTGRMGSFLDLFMDLRESIESMFAAGIKGALPGFVTGGNYDPYTDPQLSRNLMSVVDAIGASFPSGGGQGGLASQVSDPELGMNLSPLPMRVPLSDGMNLVFTDRAALDLTVRTQGNLQQALAQPRLRDVVLRTEGVNVEHDTWGTLAGIRVHSLSLGPDLSVRGFEYTLGLEDGIGLLQFGAMLLQMRTGQDLGVHSVEPPELTAVRQRIDQQAREKLPVALREQLQRLVGTMPGTPLAGLLGPAT